MMSKEEVAEIMTFCRENRVSYGARLEELGIKPWRFYDAKARYAKEQESEPLSGQGEFLQLSSDKSFVPMPRFASKNTLGRKPKTRQHEVLSIELQTPNGTIMRIRGELSAALLQSIIQASSGHVQP